MSRPPFTKNQMTVIESIIDTAITARLRLCNRALIERGQISEMPPATGHDCTEGRIRQSSHPQSLSA